MISIDKLCKNPNQLILYYVIFISLFEAVGQLCLKKFHINNGKTMRYIYLIITILMYIIVLTLLCYCYENEGKLGKVNLIWSCISIVIIIIFGFIFLQEKIEPHDVLAIIFALLAIYFSNK
jgi:multidrug transporter EmrE-like cation transporter